MESAPESPRLVALLTGATSGIGREMSLQLSARGYSLGLTGRNARALQAVASAAGPLVTCDLYPSDLAVEQSVRELAAQFSERNDRLDVLVHSAGVFARGGVGSGALEDLDSLWAVNVRAAFLLTQLLLPLLKKSRGQVVFINSSVAGGPVAAGGALYAISKYALKALADGLRAEVNPDGVRVLAIYPGRTATPMQALVHRLEDKEYHPERLLQPADVASTVIAALALPRSAEVTDVHLRPMLKS